MAVGRFEESSKESRKPQRGLLEEFSDRLLATELLHLPGKPAGVEGVRRATALAAELLHLPGKPAGVGEGRGPDR